MPFNGSGVWTPPAADFPAVALTLIQATKFNNVMNDVATAFDNCMTRDGQSPATANIPFGGFRLTGLANAVNRTDAAALAQLQDNSAVWGGVVGGTADALTMSLGVALTAYATGQIFYFKSGAAASTSATPTIAINGLAAKTIQNNGAALGGGDIAASKWYSILYDGTNFQLELQGNASWTTGDVKITLKTTADAGWVLMNDGTIGNAASAGTTRANADTVALYTLLWNSTVNADCAVSTGRGANAAADYAANKTIALPKALGRALAAYGTGAGLTARTLANAYGVETHPLIIAELATHTHTQDAHNHTQDSHLHTVAGGSGGGAGNPINNNSLNNFPSNTGGTVATNQATTATNQNTGSGTAHQNMQPTIFLNVMVKL